MTTSTAPPATSDWTEERALLAARNSDVTGFAWRAESGATEPLAHQFPTSGPWLSSRCGQIRWTVRWWTADDDVPRCLDCLNESDIAITRETRAILAIAARAAVA